MSNRAENVIYDIVKAVREVLRKHEVTFEEYRKGVAFLMQYTKAIPLTCDVWFNATISDIEMTRREGSVTNLEGPYFLEGAPLIDDRIKTREGEGEPLIIEGAVSDLQGQPIEGAELHIWHSDPKGFYSGYEQNFPINFYRGKRLIGPTGKYRIRTTVPSPYRIPHDCPTGEMLELMGRHPWRPAHVHFKIRADGFLEHTTQAYFAGGEWLNSDAVEGVRSPLIHQLKKRDGVNVLQKDFLLDRDQRADRPWSLHNPVQPRFSAYIGLIINHENEQTHARPSDFAGIPHDPIRKFLS
jgi:chlorocatechol 1,2-dioxygenase